MGELYLSPTQIFLIYSITIALLIIAWGSFLGAIYYSYKYKLKFWLVGLILAAAFVLSNRGLGSNESFLSITGALFLNKLLTLAILFFWIYYFTVVYSKKNSKFKR